ncbi:hypothetical protein [Sinorhizobium sp. BG8]|nr:hypothetical protein [Sinorhizobium sp. BG8]
MTHIAKFVSALYDIRTAVKASRQYSTLAALPHGTASRQPLRTFLPG